MIFTTVFKPSGIEAVANEIDTNGKKLSKRNLELKQFIEQYQTRK